MSLDIKKFLAATLLVLTSGVVSAYTTTPEDISLSSNLPFQTPFRAFDTVGAVAANRNALKADKEKSPARCHDCNVGDVQPDKAAVPVTDYLSFAAVADPQFNSNINGQRVAIRNVRAQYTLDKVYNNESYRGLLVAGDLTERTTKWEILQFYNALLPEDEAESEVSAILNHSKQLDRLYEGFGNHDMAKGTCCSGTDSPDDCVCESELLDIINRGERRDQIRAQPPHYSWEWDGIRFVQLNLEPADEPEISWNQSGRDPQDALQFLKAELNDAGPDKNVIVVHHYGLDRFSNKWWSDENKQAYADAIRDYRVVAIVTGHLHWSRTPSRLQQCWNDVTAVTVGSTRLGFVLDFEIIDDQMTLTRSRNGEEQWRDSYSIGQDNTTFCGNNT